MRSERHDTDTRSHSSVQHQGLDVTDAIQQNTKHKETPHPSTGHYQLEFVLIHDGSQFGGGKFVGVALGAHGGEREGSKDKGKGEQMDHE